MTEPRTPSLIPAEVYDANGEAEKAARYVLHLSKFFVSVIDCETGQRVDYRYRESGDEATIYIAPDKNLIKAVFGIQR